MNLNSVKTLLCATVVIVASQSAHASLKGCTLNSGATIVKCGTEPGKSSFVVSLSHVTADPDSPFQCKEAGKTFATLRLGPARSDSPFITSLELKSDVTNKVVVSLHANPQGNFRIENAKIERGGGISQDLYLRSIQFIMSEQFTVPGKATMTIDDFVADAPLTNPKNPKNPHELGENGQGIEMSCDVTENLKHHIVNIYNKKW